MRAAGCFQAQAVVYTGTRFERAVRRGNMDSLSRINTDTKNRVLSIPLQQVDDFTHLNCAATDGAHDIVLKQIASSKKVCVELVEGATPLPDYQHPLQALYIFGPEDGNLSQTTIDQADDVIYVPTQGCLNLAAAVNIVLYDRQNKLGSNAGSDELICQNRDTNNRLRIKTNC